jgi:hypothetical protein
LPKPVKSGCGNIFRVLNPHNCKRPQQEKLKAEKEGAEKQAQSMQREMDRISSAAAAELQGALEAAEGRKGELQGALEEAEGRMGKLQGALEEAQGKLDDALAAAETISGDLEREKEEVVRLRALEEELRTDNSEMQKEVMRLKEELERGAGAEGEVVAGLRAEVDAISGELERARASQRELAAGGEGALQAAADDARAARGYDPVSSPCCSDLPPYLFFRSPSLSVSRLLSQFNERITWFFECRFAAELSETVAQLEATQRSLKEAHNMMESVVEERDAASASLSRSEAVFEQVWVWFRV